MRKQKQRVLRLSILSMLLMSQVTFANIIYVNNQVHGGGNNGSSWSNAYSDLQQALNHAKSGDQIWIASGTYVPSQIYSPNGVPGGAFGNSDNLKTFYVPTNVSLYGGFVAGSQSLSQRDPVRTPTILSGDILKNDVASPSAAGYAASKQDNAWHVVTVGNDIALTGAKVTLDGLTIENGYAAGPDVVSGSTISYSHESGGGLYARFGSVVTLNNVTMQNNSAADNANPPAGFSAGGGAIAALDQGTQVVITNSTIDKNLAGTAAASNGEGGAIYMLDGVSGSIVNSQINNNMSGGSGGGVAVVNFFGLDSTLTVSGTSFNNDEVIGPISGTPYGGGIYQYNANLNISSSEFNNDSNTYTGSTIGSEYVGIGGVVPNSSEPNPHTLNVDGCLFSGGSADEGTITISSEGNNNPQDSATISNSLFTNNSVQTNGGAVDIDSINTTFTNDIFVGNKAVGNGGAINSDSFFASLFGLTPGTTHVNSSYFESNVSQGNNQPFESFLLASGLPVGESPGGGAIAVAWNTHVIADNDIFINNQAIGGNGGAILNGGSDFAFAPIADGATLSVTNSQFGGNLAVSGAGVATESLVPIATAPQATNATISNDLFLQNNASVSGGSIYSNNSIDVINNNQYFNNSKPNLAITNSTVNGNSD